jgi:hypothetical protein
MKAPYLLLMLATAGALPALAVPAAAQTRAEQQRWEQAQARFDEATRVFQRERDAYFAAQDRDRRYGDRYENRFETNYDASRDYRDDPRYQERTLGTNDQVYRGSDGRYYCRRSDGTTGLIVGGAAGGVLGNVIDGGRNRTAGTLIGGALGALLGRSVEQNQQQVRCR